MSNGWVFVAPPGWPSLPAGWTPPPGWSQPADWPPAPDGWQYWEWRPVEGAPGVYERSAPGVDPSPASVKPVPAPARGRQGALIAGGLLLLLVVGGFAAVAVNARGTDVVAPSALPTATAPSPTAELPAAPVMPPAASPSTAPIAPPVVAPSNPPPAVAGTALAVLDQLRVRGRGARTGYTRAQFGQAWADVNRNGCDTRNDMLRRDLRGITVKAATGGCVILSGTLTDPYTGTSIRFVRGGASEVDIDHVVALSNAWVSGASSWPYGRRVAYANDPLVLLSVDSSQNRQKGDGDAATWLPANRGYWCTYVARQIGVKKKYALSVTPAERDAMRRVLSRCPSQRVATGGGPTFASGFGSAPAGSSGSSSSGGTPSGGSASGLDPRFATCKAAKAAGYGPYVRGKDPEYAWYRDGDSDGTVCE